MEMWEVSICYTEIHTQVSEETHHELRERWASVPCLAHQTSMDPPGLGAQPQRLGPNLHGSLKVWWVPGAVLVITQAYQGILCVRTWVKRRCEISCIF